MKRFYFICLLLLTLSLLCVSCAPTVQDSDTTVPVIDALGREVSVPTGKTRTAALLGSFADVWCLAGGNVVAAPGDAWEDFDLPLDGAVNLGGAHSPSLELLFSASPDLVLASASTASHIAMKDTLEAAGIAVLYFDLDSFDDYLAMLRICTRLTGREDLYLQNGLAIKSEIDAIRTAYRDSAQDAHTRRVLFLRAASGFVKAKGSEGTVLGEMLHDLGCINIADGGTGLLENLSAEAVIREEPYHIFIVAMGEDVDAAMASIERMMAEDPAWGSLSAVKEGRLHVMDRSLFHLKPNARFGDAYEILYNILAEE